MSETYPDKGRQEQHSRQANSGRSKGIRSGNKMLYNAVSAGDGKDYRGDMFKLLNMRWSIKKGGQERSQGPCY